MNGKLVWNIKDVAELSGVSHVHGENVRGAGDVHVAAGVEREADAVQTVGGQVGHQSPGVRAHHAQRRVERGDVLQHHLLRQVSPQPGQRPHLLDRGRHEHVPENRTRSDIAIFASCGSGVKVRQGW